MRKILKTALFALAVANFMSGCSEASGENTSTEGILGEVFYYDFDIQRITGIPQTQITEYGCRYRIDGQLFLDLLSPLPSDQSNQYDSADVRALVILPGGKYYVDYQGIAIGNKQRYRIDKAKFVALLIKNDRKKCRD